MTSSVRACLLACGALLWCVLANAAPPGTVMLEDLTWTELRAKVEAGATTVLVPIGGTEQNGPHMALGKHNVRVRLLAERIAAKLGQTLVAPVVAYVPEGNIDPPTHHMRYPGTLTIPVPVFEAMLEATGRSLVRAGFHDVVFLGDHGGYAASLEHVADKLNRDWGKASRARALGEYYRTSQGPYVEALKHKGFAADEIGLHAGLADTSLMLALAPSMVRMDVAAERPRGAPDGVSGDPKRSSAELGQLGVDRIVEATVAAIRQRTRISP
jgi:creatinine amidohydrolase/Fe(II)-dependent formamide hydrolase-like protein